MGKTVEVHTDAKALNNYLYELSIAHKRFVEDAESLAYAFSKAQWNDAVAEKTRQQVNMYFNQLNHALGCLEGVIRTVEELSAVAEQYEALE